MAHNAGPEEHLAPTLSPAQLNPKIPSGKWFLRDVQKGACESKQGAEQCESKQGAEQKRMLCVTQTDKRTVMCNQIRGIKGTYKNRATK